MRTRKNLELACKNAGGQTKLGEAIGKDQGFIWHLLNRANTIKAGVALKVSDVSGIPFEDIVSDFEDASEPAQ